MGNEKLWRQEGPKALLEFLSTVTGEDYDAVVYDTKFDFDTNNIEAVRYIAGIAMTKASLGIENFEIPMPTDGSIEPYEDERGNPAFRHLKDERVFRETNIEGSCIYVPDSQKYRQKVVEALKNRNIPYDDMTDTEKKEYLKLQNQEAKEEKSFEFWHHYFPIAVALLLACIGFLGIIIKLTS